MDGIFDIQKGNSLCPKNKSASRQNEKGIALIVTISMLFILSVLGVFSLANSTTDLHIAGNFRNQMLAQYNADVMEGYGVNNQSIISAISPGVVNSYPSGTGFTTVPDPTGSVGFIGDTSIRVEYLCSTLPLRGMSETSAVVHHFLVTAVGRGASRTIHGTSEAVVETEEIRIDRVDKNTLDAFPWPRCANDF